VNPLTCGRRGSLQRHQPRRAHGPGSARAHSTAEPQPGAEENRTARRNCSGRDTPVASEHQRRRAIRTLAGQRVAGKIELSSAAADLSGEVRDARRRCASSRRRCAAADKIGAQASAHGDRTDQALGRPSKGRSANSSSRVQGAAASAGRTSRSKGLPQAEWDRSR